MWGIFGRHSGDSSHFEESHRRRRSSESVAKFSPAPEFEGINGSGRPSSATPTQNSPLKRYAMYDLDYQDFTNEQEIKDKRIVAPDSALAARETTQPSNPPLSPTTSLPQTTKTSSVVSNKSSMFIDTTIKATKELQDIAPLSPHGITVTKVKVVEYHSATEDEAKMTSRNSLSNLSTTNNPNNENIVPNFKSYAQALNSTNLKGKHRHSFSDSDLNSVASIRKIKSLEIGNSLLTDNQAEKNRTTSSKMVSDKEQKSGRGEEIKKQPKDKKQSLSGMWKGKGNRKSLVMNRFQPEILRSPPWELPDQKYMNVHPRKLEQPRATTSRRQMGQRWPRDIELAPTSNPAYSNDPTDLEDDGDPLPLYDSRFPWVPKPLYPPQLMHVTLVPLPRKKASVQQLNSITKRPSLVLAPNSRPGSRILSPNSDRSSRLISCNPHNITRIMSSKPKRMSRVASQRKRASIIVTGGKRSSVLLRRQLLEDSVMMSLLGGAYDAPSKKNRASIILASQTKTVIRRKTKKGSNAKVEDREARRERKRREKKEKKRREKLEGTNAEQGEPKTLNSKPENGLEVTRIIKTQELVRKMEEESRKQENLLIPSPLPPPRRPQVDRINTSTIEYPPTKRPPVNGNSLLASLGNRTPEQRALKSDIDVEPPAFPTHLTPSPSYMEHSTPSSRLQTIVVKQPGPLVKPSLTSVIKSELSSDDDQSDIGTTLLNSSPSEPQDPTSITASPAFDSGKRNKSGMSLLGLFNKQPSRETRPRAELSPAFPPSTSPQSPSSPTYSVTSTTPRTPLSPPTHIPLFSSINGPIGPLSPPLPPRSLPRTPSPQSPPSTPRPLLNTPRPNRPRRATESAVPLSPTSASEAEKLKKMQEFEALIAVSTLETSKQKNKRKHVQPANIITANAIIAGMNHPNLDPALASNFGSGPVAMLPEKRMRQRNVPVPPSLVPGGGTGRVFNESIGVVNMRKTWDGNYKKENLSHINDERISEDRESLAISVADSLTPSVAESFTVHYRPEEHEELGRGRLGEDGVIRVTLTPAVCR
ncbi:hypothetical protein G9A89_006111 [Geosiphon pyriformis]|nr:hypothetical protein G9A89_006111 [Geosiphon pyriformis]